MSVSELLGESETEHSVTAHPIGSSVSAALLSYGRERRPADPPSLENLRRRVDEAWSIWQTSIYRYSDASRIIVDLISDVEHARRALPPTDDAKRRRQLEQIAADLYFLLRSFTRRIGRSDLSMLVADRALRAAEEADDPLRIAAARWNLGHVLLAHGEAEGAEDVVVRAAEQVRRDIGDDCADALALRGALYLTEAVAAVRKGDGWKARDILRELAWPLAQRTGEGNVMWTVFGPTNVGLHPVSIEMESGEAAQALRLADHVDASTSPSLERRTTFALEVARCHEQRRDDPAVLLHLMIAEQTGPEDLRYNPLARDLIHGLLKRARPTYAGHVKAFAERIGVLS